MLFPVPVLALVYPTLEIFLVPMYEVVLLSPAFSDCVLYHQTKGNAEPEDYLTVTIYNALAVHTSYCRIYVGARYSRYFAMECAGFYHGPQLCSAKSSATAERERDSPERGPNTYVGRYGVLCMGKHGAKVRKWARGCDGAAVRTRQNLSPFPAALRRAYGKRMMGCRVGSWASITAGVDDTWRGRRGAFGEADLFYFFSPPFASLRLLRAALQAEKGTSSPGLVVSGRSVALEWGGPRWETLNRIVILCGARCYRAKRACIEPQRGPRPRGSATEAPGLPSSPSKPRFSLDRRAGLPGKLGFEAGKDSISCELWGL